MKRLLVVFVLTILSSLAASAAPVPCASVVSQTLDAFIATNADGGCYDDDKLYTNFSYNQGLSSVAVGDVQVSISMNPVFNQHTVNFQSLGGWEAFFEVGFNIATYQTPPTWVISAVSFDITVPQVPGSNNVSAASMENTPNNDAFFTLVASNVGGGDIQTGLDSTAIDVLVRGFPAQGTIQQVSTNFFQTASPEPASMLTLGAGLLGLGLYRRRR